MKAYLCGSMTGLKDQGAGWRKKITKWLVKQGYKVYDPCVKELGALKTNGVTRKNYARWEYFPQKLQEHIIRTDLRAILTSELIICYYTRPSTGTVSELTWAFYHNIPIYFVLTGSYVEGWPLTIANRNKVFSGFADLKDFMKEKYAKSK